MPMRLAVLGAAFLLVAGACGGAPHPTSSDDLEMAPPFELMDQAGRVYTLDDLLSRGPAVLVFYRGHW